MFLTYHELKELLYIGLSLIGGLLTILSFYQFHLASSASDPFVNILTAMILAIVGSVCIFFGIETYILRDDPDIWR